MEPETEVNIEGAMQLGIADAAQAYAFYAYLVKGQAAPVEVADAVQMTIEYIKVGIQKGLE